MFSLFFQIHRIVFLLNFFFNATRTFYKRNQKFTTSDDSLVLYSLFCIKFIRRFLLFYTIFKNFLHPVKIFGDFPAFCPNAAYHMAFFSLFCYRTTHSTPSSAFATSASTSSARSASSTLNFFGRVSGCFGVNTVQQSSYGRMDVSKVSILREI